MSSRDVIVSAVCVSAFHGVCSVTLPKDAVLSLRRDPSPAALHILAIAWYFPAPSQVDSSPVHTAGTQLPYVLPVTSQNEAPNLQCLQSACLGGSLMLPIFGPLCLQNTRLPFLQGKEEFVVVGENWCLVFFFFYCSPPNWADQTTW